MSFFSELGKFFRTNKKLILPPVIIIFVLLGAFLFLSGGAEAVAPFVYRVF